MGNHTSTRARARQGDIASISSERGPTLAQRQASTTRPLRQPKAPKAPKPPSPTQRNKQAVEGIVAALSATDEKSAITAALEVVNEQLASDAALRQRMGEKYQELLALAPRKQEVDLGPAPVRIAGDWTTYSPSAKFDPYRRVVEYGQHQLRAVLVRATQTRLREAAKIVMERNPGTKPTSLSSNPAMIDYIMEHVAPGY